MVKLLRMPNRAIVDSLKGSVDFYFWMGIPVARRWPYYPPRDPHPAEAAWQAIFGYCAGLWNQLSTLIKQRYKRMALTSSYTGRDLFMRSFLSGIKYSRMEGWGVEDPAVILRWTGLNYQHSWVGNVKHIVLTTDRTCHLWAVVSSSYPYNRDRHVIWRGMERRHGLDVYFTPEFTIEQIEPGDTMDHTFDIPGWFYCYQRYWYFMGTVEGFRSYSNTCFFTQHFTEPGPVPGPQPFVGEICWHVVGRDIRCGNHYSFYANDTYYALVPSLGSLQVWKKVGMGMVRQDAANEPLPTTGVFADGDGRVQSATDLLHVVGFERVASPGPHNLHYAVFDCGTDTWDPPELVCQPRFSFFANHECSISVDAAGVPHVVYHDYSDGFPEIHYRNRVGGVWSAPEIALNPLFQVMLHPSCWIDLIDGAFHVIATTNNRVIWYKRRAPAPPAWDAIVNVGSSQNLPFHSICANVQDPHIAGIPLDNKIDHWEDQPPVTWQQDLSLAPSNYANVLNTPATPSNVIVLFRDFETNLAYIHRIGGGAWQPEWQIGNPGVIIVTANYHHPDIVTALYTKAGASELCLRAFWCPWH